MLRTQEDLVQYTMLHDILGTSYRYTGCSCVTASVQAQQERVDFETLQHAQLLSSFRILHTRGPDACKSAGPLASVTQAQTFRCDTCCPALHFLQVGEETFDAWKPAHPADFALVMRKFEAAKCSFTGAEPIPVGGDDDESEDDYLGPAWSILIPPSLHSQIQQGYLDVLNVEQHSTDSIILRPQEMRQLFDPIVQRVVELVVQQVHELGEAGTPASQVLGAGGFMTSPYLKRRLAEALATLGVSGTPVPLIEMRNPEAAVVKGKRLLPTIELCHVTGARCWR